MSIAPDIFDLLDEGLPPVIDEPAGAGDRYSDLLRHDTVPFQAIGMMQQAEQPGSQPVWLTEDSTLPDARGANLAHPASAIFNIPASWHDYLSGPAPAVTAHEHQEQQVTNDSSAGSKAEQTAAALQTKQEAKQQRIREKNRRAMQKFRNKQREKSEQAEARVQELTKQVSDLTVQVETLQQEKLQLLQQDRACPNTKYAVPGCESTGPNEWEPRYGWVDFDPQATIVLHSLTESRHVPLRVTPHDLQCMTLEELKAIWQIYIAKAAPLLVEADGDLCSPAGVELQAMKYELHAFASNLSLHNPALKYAEQMDDAGLPYSSPEQAAQDRAKLIKGMKLSAAQRAQLAMVHLIVRADMDRLRQERAEILISLSALAQKEEGNLVPTQFGPILAALRALLWVTEELHRCQASFKAACFGSTLDHIQMARALVLASPRAVPMWELTADLLRDAGQDGLGDARQQSRVLRRYREKWKVWEQSTLEQDHDMLDTGLAPSGKADLLAMSGDLQLHLPKNVPANNFAPDVLI